MITTTVSGLRELKEALDQLPKSTARGIQERALLKGAQLIVAAAKAKAPVDKGDLRNSITATTKRPRGHKTPAAQAFAAAVGAGATLAQARLASKAAGSAPVEVFVGPGRHPQAIQQEFGNRNHGPQPFMRPAWDENQDKVLASLATDLGDEIFKSAARAAKKQVRNP